jgi:hypothetical protein
MAPISNAAVRAVLAIGVVAVSMIVVVALALYPVFSGVDHAAWADVFGKMISPFTGLVGVIVGYYFGRDQ